MSFPVQPAADNGPQRTNKPAVRNGGISLQTQDVTDWSSLKRSAESDAAGFAQKAHDVVYKDGLRWEGVRNVKAMQDALADVKVPVWDNAQKRAVHASAFPALAGNLTVAGVNDAYMNVPTIGQELVREWDDNKKDTTVVGIVDQYTSIDEVSEGKPFPLMSAGEETFKIAHKRNGRRVAVTQETIEENDIPGIVQRINTLGEWMAVEIEKQTIRRVMDVDGSGASAAEPYVLHLNGSASSLYTTTANSPGTRAPSGTRINNNALENTTDLETARARLADMVDHRGDPITVDQSEMILLVPDALWVTAWKILNSTFEPGVFNEKNFFGDAGAFRPRLLSSRHLDNRSTDTWFLGCFKKQFVRKWKLRPETVVLPGTGDGGAQSFLDARIGFQARVAFDCEVGAIDYVYVVQNLAATTAPS